MAQKTNPKEIAAATYDDAYFLSEAIEGYARYQRGELSALREKHRAMLAPAPGLRLLEIGFARGELLRACAQDGAQVTGIDFSPHACRIARETLGDTHAALVRGDCRKLPIADGVFDRVFAGDVIEHLPFVGGIALLREMHRVLRPGGRLLIHTTPNAIFRHWTYRFGRPLLRCLSRELTEQTDEQFRIMDRVHVHEYSTVSLRRVARAAGLAHARVWIDPDPFRGGQHRITEQAAQHPLLRLAAAQTRFAPCRFFLGNDLYLEAHKPGG